MKLLQNILILVFFQITYSGKLKDHKYCINENILSQKENLLTWRTPEGRVHYLSHRVSKLQVLTWLKNRPFSDLTFSPLCILSETYQVWYGNKNLTPAYLFSGIEYFLVQFNTMASWGSHSCRKSDVIAVMINQFGDKIKTG